MAVIQTSFLSDSEDRRNLLQTQPSDSAVAMPLHVPASLSNALQDRKSGQDQPGAMAQVREQAQSAGVAREEYPINLSFQQWDVLNRMANQTENPEEALSRYAAATLFSKEYDVPFENALENLDAYSEHLIGTAFSGNTSAVQSIVNAFKAGRKNMNYSDLAAQFKRMDMRGEDTTELLAQLSAVSEEILALKDNQPRNVITKMLQVTAESALPYMIEVTKASALGSLAMGSVAGAWQLASGVALGSITAAAPWTLAALMAVGGTVAAINRTRELEEGVMYLQLRELGIDKDIADPVSRFTGLTVGWIEAAFGVEFATLSKLVGWEASSALTASLSSSGWFQGFIKGLANLTGNAANEFLQEALEEVQDHAAVHLAHAIQSHRGEVEELPDVDIIRDTFEAGLSGFASALVLGIPGLAIDVRQGFKGAVEIRDNARANPSKEAFIKQVSEAKPESMTQGQWNEAMSHLWEKENADQPLSSAIQSDEAAIAELDVGEGKKGRPEGRVQRLSSGRLYMGEADTITVDRSGAEHHQALVGDPRTGNRYGYIEYSLTDNAIDIESVRTRSGYESIRKEAIIELARRYPGYEITWNTANETLAKIKEEIISENPLGAEKGLQYFDGLTDVDDRLYVEAQIKKAMPNLNATERALGATLIQLRAENEGLDAQSYLEATYQNGEIFGAIDSKTAELLEGKKGAAQFSKDLKAVIYAGQNADFSTFVHETFHVSLRQLQDRSELGTAIREAAGTKEFVQWLEEHRDLFSDSNFSEMDTAALVEIAQKFDESALNRQQEEFAARLFEGYLLDGKSASKRLGAFLEHIATWMRKIYNTIANRVALDDRIVKAFDAIFEANERAQEADGAEQSSTPAETQVSSETKEAQKPESSFIPLGSEEANKTERVEIKEVGSPRQVFPIITQEENRKNRLEREIRFQEAPPLKSEAFSKWFGDSKVVDENGDPLVVYHGSFTDSITEFETGFRGIIYFTDSQEVAHDYAGSRVDMKGGTNSVYEAYMRMANPATPEDSTVIDILYDRWGDESYTKEDIIEAFEEGHDPYQLLEDESVVQALLDAGYDGVQFYEEGALSYGVFSPNQIKSATGNIGTFDGENPNILFQEAPSDYQPKSTGIGYKVFVQKDGKLYPPMVANPNGEGTPVGKWLLADEAPIAAYSKTGRPQVKSGGKGTQGKSGLLAYRPGWHLGEIPYAKQFNRLNPATGNKELFPKDFVWAEVEYSKDNDYNEEARQNGASKNGGFNHALASLHRMPTDGFYNYRTNPDPTTDPWVITGAMKVNKILTREEVETIVKDAGREPQKVEGDNILFQEDGKPQISNDYPTRPTIDPKNWDFKKTSEQMSEWKNQLREWVDKQGDLIQFGDEKLLYIVHKNVIPWEKPWRTTTFINREQGWVPTGHRDYATKYLAVLEEVGGKEYRSDILFQESADERYFKALQAGDEEAAQKIVDSVARSKGYVSNNDFRMRHEAPNSHDGYSARLDKLNESELLPKDFWGHPLWYTTGDAEMRSFYKVKAAVERFERNGKAGLWVYRAVPKDTKESFFRNGDWVTPDRQYAVEHGSRTVGKYRTISQWVPLEHLYWDVNSIAELGFDDGKEYVYRDTKNNRKLNDTVVRDDDGNIIPPSRRFNYRSDTLFQEITTTDSDYNFSEFMLEEARGFDDYQELMSYYLAFADPDEQVVTDESWYQALWEKAHGIEEKTDLYEDDITRREQLREKAKEVNDAAKEATFLGEIEYSDNIVKFLKELGYIISSNRTWEDTADPIRRETVEYIKANAKKLIHPIIHANALRTLAGDREITIKSIRQIRTLMSGEGSSWYRDFYADVMDRPDLKSEIIDSRLPDIDQPSYRRLDNFSITDRVRLAEQIEATQLKKEFLSGKEKVDGVAEKIIKALDYEISKLHEDIAKYEADLEMLAAESLERKKEYAKNEYDYRKEIGSYDSAFWKIRNLAKEDAQFPKKSDPGSGFKFYGENKGNLLYEQVIKMRKSERMAETVKRQEALAKLKDKLTEKQKQRDDAKKVRQYKLQLARRIMAKPSDAINYEQARMIYEKQAPLDPAYRMARIVVDVGDQFQRMTIEEAKEFFANTTEEDIRKNIGDRNYERLTEKRRPLNEWTILELEDLAEDIANTRAEGRRILAAKKARQMEIARSIQADIMQSLIVDSRYKYKDRPIPGSHEEHMEKRSPFRSAKAFRYATFPMRSKAMMLDGDKMGSAYKLLITEKRNAQDAENRAIDKRIDPIVKLMMDLNVKDTDLYKTVSVALGTDKSVKMTYPALMYAYLSQFNPDNRNAVAYGNLVTQDEKATLKHDNASIKTLGDNRYQALIAQAEYHLSETPGMLEIAQAIQADFNNPEHVAKLQAIAIEEFNRPMREVESYLAIQRLSVDTEVMDEQIRDDLFNRNAGSLPTGVQKGFTKERINISPDHQRPVNMDLIQVWNRAVRQQEHFNAFASYGRMVNRVFKGRGAVDIRNVIARTLGTEMLHDLDNYINDVINPIGDRKLKGMEKAVGFMRGNLGAAYLTWKMSSIVLQAITSPAPYLIEVNPIYMAKGYLDLMAHPIEAIDRINEMSPMMKHRTMNPMISDILERSKQYHTNLTSKTLYKAQEIGSLGLTWVDRYAVAGGWLGAYYQEKDKLMKSGMSEEQADARAIAYADDITLKTQPTGDATEIAPLFTQGSEFARAFTQFTTAMNVIWTNITYDMPVSARNLINKETPTEVKKREFSRVVGTIVGYGLAGAVLGAVQEGFKGEDDDWVAKLRRTIYWSFTQATESVPLIGRGVDAMIESLVTGDRVHVFSDNFFPGVDKLVQGVLHLTQEDFAKALQRLMEGTGYLIGAPVSGINQAIKTFKEGPKAMLGR